MIGRFTKIDKAVRGKNWGVSIEGHCGGHCGLEEGRICDVCRAYHQDRSDVGVKDGLPDEVA